MEENTTDVKVKPRLSRFPLSRIKTIMKSSPDVLLLSQDSVFLIAKAAEMFVEYLAKESFKLSKDRVTIGYKDLAEVVNSKEYLEFLQDIIPRKMKAKDYWDILKRVEEEEKNRELDI
ncbi:chromatin accessibility complex protein 1 [Centruroides vittatus]|uniref:chromatin accessibility complex protein 1 n=1 Tax=Centruroides vittatus TaxID=120091 RepID=UPI00350F4187